jgi:hypothetical protein
MCERSLSPILTIDWAIPPIFSSVQVCASSLSHVVLLILVSMPGSRVERDSAGATISLKLEARLENLRDRLLMNRNRISGQDR